MTTVKHIPNCDLQESVSLNLNFPATQKKMINICRGAPSCKFVALFSLFYTYNNSHFKP